MTFEEATLLALLLVPLAGAVIVWLLGPRRGALTRAFSLGVSVIVLALCLILVARFMALERSFERPSDDELSMGAIATFVPEFVPGSTAANPHRTTWKIMSFENGAIHFFLGVDGLSIWLILLTGLLMMPSVLVSYSHIQERVNEFYAWLLLLQTCLFGVFLAFDIVLFYMFFELSLLPLFFLIGIWGGAQRQWAARKFFVYTLAGSLFTLLGVIGVVVACFTSTKQLIFSIPDLVSEVHAQLAREAASGSGSYWASVQFWTFLALMFGFAVKVPLVPFHTWLPLAHVEAPTAGSVDLAGILLKIGSYGFLRLCIPLAPDAALAVGLPLVTWMAATGVVYGALCALAQNDIKRLIAYSSISHLGLCMLGMFSFDPAGLQGSLLHMFNHGLSTGALFLMIGMLYDRYHTREIKDYGGMAAKMPLLAIFLIFFSLSSVGLPGLNGFVSEFLCLAGIFAYEVELVGAHVPVLAIIGASGIILGAWYMIELLRKLLFGPLKEPHHEGEPVRDLSFREWGMLAPLAVLCVVLGVFPMLFLKVTEPDVQRISLVVERARARAGVVTHAGIDPQGEVARAAAK